MYLMAKRPFARIAILFSLAALPVATFAQAPSAAPTLTVTADAVASGPVSGAIVAVIIRGGGSDAAGLEAVLAKAGVSDFVNDNGLLSLIPPDFGVRGRMAAITPGAFAAIEDAAQEYARTHHGASLLRIGYYGLEVDCPAIAARARASALADAQTQAEGIASSEHIGLGNVTSVVEARGCRGGGRLAGSYAMDPKTLAMRVPVEERVTYAAARP
jgi:uncharacterized protein YggE